MKSLVKINKLLAGDLSVLKTEKWLMHLYLTEETNINLEGIKSVNSIKPNAVLKYVKKTLEILNDVEINDKDKLIIEKVLMWNEVSKCGMSHQRKLWKDNGINLFVHNVGSAQIYFHSVLRKHISLKDEILIQALIQSHGLIGQFLRGEVNLKDNIKLTNLLITNIISKNELREILIVLNKCIIGAVSMDLWNNLEKDVKWAINLIIDNEYEKEFTIKERLKKLRQTAIVNGEDFDKSYLINFNDSYREIFYNIFNNFQLWYVEGALSDFSFIEFLKIFAIINVNIKNMKSGHIDFSNLMRSIYYDYNNKKAVNIYKKRIIEWYLNEIDLEDILSGSIPNNEHIGFNIEVIDDVVSFNFKFSNASRELISFCAEAQGSELIYRKAIYLLYDLFSFRKDEYDRFHNEEIYLDTMNSSIDQKTIILDYIVGDKVIDVGPGGGALMDKIEDRYPEKKVLGIDISDNVVESLIKRKYKENRQWDIMKGNILALDKYVSSNSIDTIIFSSIIHELYSYIPYNGKKFNIETVKAVLKNAFKALNKGGRIIIRDGIMTENKELVRLIRFKDKKDLAFLERYSKDFKGREINYKILSNNPLIVEMSINDAMEFLYTYTWGEESYAQEVEEQFGYLTPKEYEGLIKEIIGDKGKIVKFKHYLQDGYTKSLKEKIDFMDENYNEVRLPDSTCLIVIEKEL